MLGAENGGELNAFRAREYIDRAAAGGVGAGLIGDHADALPAKRREMLVFEHVDAGSSVIALGENAGEIVGPGGVSAALEF